MITKNHFLLFMMVLFGLHTRAQTPKHIKKDYTLFWKDQFKGKSLDASKWDIRGEGTKRHHATVSADAVFLDGKGHLILATLKKGDQYFIGHVGTQKTLLTTYGYFECRAKMNTQRGPHKAFWLQSPEVGKTDGDTAKNGTEIDIFEYHTNKGTDIVYHNLHWNGYGTEHKSEGIQVKQEGIEEGYHTFGLEWTPNSYIFYVDGKETWRTETAVSHRPQYMILSTELTGWGGDFSESDFPDYIYFDYVKVYKKKPY